MVMMKVSVIVPCHNEATRIKENCARIKAVLQSLNVDYEVVLEEDGSTDGTGDIIKRLSAKDHKIVALSFPQLRRGKGWGFRKLVEASSGDVIISMDADLSTSPDVIKEFLPALQTADVLITNRYASPESKIPLRRRAPSLAYNAFLRILFGIRVRDTQSGFKAYRKGVFDRVKLASDGFEYDIELLAKAHRLGLRVREIPVKYIYRKDARFSVISHGPRMVLGTVRLWKRMKV